MIQCFDTMTPGDNMPCVRLESWNIIRAVRAVRVSSYDISIISTGIMMALGEEVAR